MITDSVRYWEFEVTYFDGSHDVFECSSDISEEEAIKRANKLGQDTIHVKAVIIRRLKVCTVREIEVVSRLYKMF